MSRILVIDDDIQVREMLKELFEMADYEVLLAPDGGAAMKLHCANPADVVITDIVMPEKEGLETIIEFRRRFPGVKLIAISGGGRIEANEYLKTALHLGAQKAFSKPFEVIELLNTVRELLKNNHA